MNQATPEMEFKVGDLVRHKASKEPMVIAWAAPYQEQVDFDFRCLKFVTHKIGEPVAVCEWYRKGEYQKNTFLQSSLERFSEESK